MLHASPLCCRCKGPSTADTAALNDKQHLQKMIQERCVSPFRCDGLRFSIAKAQASFRFCRNSQDTTMSCTWPVMSRPRSVALTFAGPCKHLLHAVPQRRERAAPAAHNMTDFRQWFEATEPYTIEYANDFEPWFLAARNRTQASRAWYGVMLVVETEPVPAPQGCACTAASYDFTRRC